jgi:hypothetical protein
MGEKWAVVGGSTPPVATVLDVRPHRAVGRSQGVASMRTRHNLVTALVVALSGTALAGPALAGSGQDLRSPDAIDAGAISSPPAGAPTRDLRSPDAIDAGTAARPAPIAEPAVVGAVASQPSTGFDWGSAAIGAAGTIGLVAVALGSALAVHRRRAPVPPSAVAS